MNTTTAQEIALTATCCPTGVTFTATFTGPDADRIAAAWIRSRRNYAFSTADLDLEPEEFPETLDTLFPTCEHGLSESLCAGPGHYPADH